MKANELMLGDFVTFKDCQNDKEVIVVKIWEINQEGNALVFIDDSDSLDEVTIDEEFVGIPLTPEILEKNGFKRSEVFVEWKYEKDDVYILWKPFHWIDIEYGECSIKFPCEYVHELQHALKLCGIDKTIEP